MLKIISDIMSLTRQQNIPGTAVFHSIEWNTIQLSLSGHLAIADTPTIRTLAKSLAKINYSHLTEIYSRYNGISLFEILARGPEGVRNKGS